MQYVLVSLSFCFFLHFQFQLENGFWILLTVLFVCQPSFSETRKRLLRRSFGTLLGIAISFPALLFINNRICTIILMILSAFFFFNYVRTNYGLAVIFITLFVMLVSNIQKNTGIDVLSGRIIETLAGCLLSVLAISFIYPDWQFKRFPSLANELLTKVVDTLNKSHSNMNLVAVKIWLFEKHAFYLLKLMHQLPALGKVCYLNLILNNI